LQREGEGDRGTDRGASGGERGEREMSEESGEEKASVLGQGRGERRERKERRGRRGEEGRRRWREGGRGREFKGMGKKKIAGVGEGGPVCLAKGEEETAICGGRGGVGEGRGTTPCDRVVEAVVIRPRERRAVPV